MSRTVVCVKCCLSFGAQRIGIYLIEQLKDGSVYRVWHADVSVCSGCGTEIVYQFAQNPLAEKFEKDKMEMALSLVEEAKKLTAVDNVQRVYYWKEA